MVREWSGGPAYVPEAPRDRRPPLSGQCDQGSPVLDPGSAPLHRDQPFEGRRRNAVMRITYLLTTADARAGTERAIAEQTNAMSAMGHEVVVASVYRLDEPGFSFGDRVTVDYMTSLEGPSGSPSLMIPTEWDSQFCLSTDAPIIDYLRRCTADVVVTTTPALTVFALHACAADIRIVQQEHRNS